MKAAEAKIARLLQSALQHHQSGALPQAEALYREVLRLDPTHPDALHLLGVIATRQGRHEQAAELIRKAIGRHPSAPSYHVNLGNALQELGRLADAAQCFETALRLDPRSVEAWTNLGNLHQKRGELEQAVSDYRQALAFRPGHLNALRGLAQALSELGRISEAIECLRQALALDPDDETTLARAALSLNAAGRAQEAAQVSERLVGLQPHRHDHLTRHAGFLLDAGQGEAALRAAQAAVEAAPESAAAQNQLGWVLTFQDRFAEAWTAFRRARELDPRFAGAPTNESLALWRMGRVEEAVAAARHASELAPDNEAARSNYLMFSNYDPTLPPERLFHEHRAWGIARCRNQPPHPPARVRRGPRERLRIGYVSGDFRMHSVGFFMEAPLACHDRSKFEVYCYFNSKISDAKTQRLKALADRWHEVVALSDERLAEQIRRDEIDILVDLSGHTSDGRLGAFAHKPAPVQVTYLGYPNTTGLPTIDYRITDAIADPPGVSEALNVERLVRLPRGFLCYRPEPDAPPVTELPCLAGGHVTFGSFNVLSKLSPQAMALWARILAEVPGSRLVLKTRALADPDPRERMTAAFQGLGISADRITLLPGEAGYGAHLQRYSEVDIALDPFPYNGTTTTCEALWMGVPVVTLRGDRHCARVGAGLLNRIGLDELVAESPEDYVAAAVRLARDPARLQRLRRELRAMLQASPLMDGAGFTRELETAYRSMYQEPQQPEARAEAPELRLRLRGEVSIYVPRDVWALTPYVLLEQEDWFEDEIRFVRDLVEQGTRAIDIGANYGLYTLAMARRAGSVWAFEPADRTASWLERSVAANGFGHVEVVRAGVSDRSGSALLALEDNPELNRVLEGEAASASAERIELVSLDDFAGSRGLPPIDLMKIDAEGQEENILRGGASFFKRHSPLVMFEIKHGAVTNRVLVERFAALGYRPYRLVPGLGLLAPWQADAASDAFQLNLFACKQDRAQALAARGLLVQAQDAKPIQRLPQPGAWQRRLGALPYAAGRMARWTAPAASDPARARHLEALDCHAAASDPALPAKTRLASLTRALHLLRALAKEAPNAAALQSLARLAWEAGQRQEASQALAELRTRLEAPGSEALDEPFLCVSPEFEARDPAGRLRDWCLASVVHQMEKLGAWSSYWGNPGKTLAAVDTLSRLGHLTGEMERRRQLVRLRYGLQEAPEPNPLLAVRTEDNLNPEFWAGRSD